MRAQAAKADRVFIARADTNKPKSIIAALRLCPLGNSWLLRSMCVDQPFQRHGVGRQMLKLLKAELATTNCYCFAWSHLQDFYQQAGFSLIDIDQASDEIANRFKQYADNNRDIQLMQFTGN